MKQGSLDGLENGQESSQKSPPGTGHNTGKPAGESNSKHEPLAARMRPRQVDHFVGQTHILGPGKPLREAIVRGAPHSMILWGPPGTGKTTLANLVADSANAHVERLSAVLSGVKDIRAAVERARTLRQQQDRLSILFVDEVHRFNKSQQDAFLPHIENGTIVFIGATTENPSFELNNALLSRARVYVLQSLDDAALLGMLERALSDTVHGLGQQRIVMEDDALARIARAADGDARRALNLLELAVDLAHAQTQTQTHAIDPESVARINNAILEQTLTGHARRFDKGGDVFHEQISAMHKAVRGSSPDAALYWLLRMLDGGCDPAYVARRLVRMASEDIGNADPRALQIALDGWDAMTRLGSPEGELALAQAVTYLAVAPKSNAVYQAFNAARADIASSGSHEVPAHLRNAATALMKAMGHGAEYRYAHDEEGAYAAGENYFPEALKDRRYYHPVAAGLELKIGEKLANLRQRDEQSRRKRYTSPPETSAD